MNLKFYKCNTRPSTGEQGAVYFISSEKKICIYNKSKWEEYTQESGGESRCIVDYDKINVEVNDKIDQNTLDTLVTACMSNTPCYVRIKVTGWKEPAGTIVGIVLTPCTLWGIGYDTSSNIELDKISLTFIAYTSTLYDENPVIKKIVLNPISANCVQNKSYDISTELIANTLSTI